MLIDWFTVIAQVVNFLILIFLLRRFLYQPILRMMDEREQRVTAELRAAAEMKAQADQEIETYQQKNREFDENRNRMTANAKAEVDATRADLLEKARQDVDSAHARWHEALEQEKQTFLKDLRQRIGYQTYALARKALADLANADLERQLVSVFLDRFRTLKQAEVEAFAKALWQNGQHIVVCSAFELSLETRKQVEETLHERLRNSSGIQFETTPDLLCGIEVKSQEHKIAWSLEAYFEELEKKLTETFKVKIDG